jgi:diguanylate cyclase (GGDEF)-like protein
MTDTRARRTRRWLFSLILVVSVGLPALGFWWATGQAHEAVERRAMAGNAAAAAAYAAQVQRQFQDRVAIADDLLVLLANGTRLSGWADEQRLVNPFCRVSFLDARDVPLAALPLPTCAPLPAHVPATALRDGTAVTAAVVTDGSAVFGVRIALNAVERAAVDPAGRLRSLQVQCPVDGLIAEGNAAAAGSYTVVDVGTGVVLASANKQLVGVRIGSPAAREAVLTRRATSMLTYAPHLHQRVLTSYQPVPGTTLGVFVSLPTERAFAEATHLQHVLLAGAGVILLVGLALALLVVRAIGDRDRRLLRQLDELSRLAGTDALTGLANRSAMTGILDHDLALVRRGQLDGLTVMYLDLDGVKSANDSYGHDRGDQLIVATAGAMTRQIRPSDTLARIGGDEFVLIAPGAAAPADTSRLAERLRAAVAATIVDADGVRLAPLTVSIGVSVVHAGDTETDADTVLRAADQAMYDAKRAGGNAVCMAGVGMRMPAV